MQRALCTLDGWNPVPIGVDKLQHTHTHTHAAGGNFSPFSGERFLWADDVVHVSISAGVRAAGAPIVFRSLGEMERKQRGGRATMVLNGRRDWELRLHRGRGGDDVVLYVCTYEHQGRRRPALITLSHGDSLRGIRGLSHTRRSPRVQKASCTF